MSEADWKKIRRMEEALKNKLFETKLHELRRIIDDPSKTPQARYHALHPFIKTSNDDIDNSFNMRRSNMMMILFHWRRLKLIQDSDLDQFSDGLSSQVRNLLSISRG
jgi:hypothetical protein